MIKVLIPSFIVAFVFFGSLYLAYRCIIATSWWRWCAILPLLLLYIIIYGFTWGFCQLNVKEVVYEDESVPESFDGYKIAQISDIHCGGSFWGPYRHLLGESVDKINELNPDAICFVGDLQNFLPKEAKEFKAEFSRLKAKDGVFTIMGNHDYASYSKLGPMEQRNEIRKTREMQRSFGWDMLQDEHRFIYRTRATSDTTTVRDSICIIGEENWGLPPFPQRGDINKAIAGLDSLPRKASDPSPFFTLMLSHDPNAWRHHILPVFRPNVTLSGHTHGTQFAFFGWTPAKNIYQEWGGFYYDHNSLLSVSVGLGGNLPFRFGMPREIVLITLKHKK